MGEKYKRGVCIEYQENNGDAKLCLTGRVDFFSVPEVYDFLKQKKIIPERDDGYDKGFMSAARKFYQEFCRRERQRYDKKLEMDFSDAETPDLSSVAMTIEVAKNIGSENLIVLLNKKNVKKFDFSPYGRMLNRQVI